MGIVYTGTMTGQGHFTNRGKILDVRETDAITDDITIKADGSFSGTQKQVVTVTISTTINGKTTSSTTTQTLINTISGKVGVAFGQSQTVAGQTASWASTLSSDYSMFNDAGI